MSEALLWTRTRRALNIIDSKGTYLRIEDALNEGISDVHYCFRDANSISVTGWIELKHLDEWPKRASTKVKVRHYTDEQRGCIADYNHSGGRASMLLQVGDDILFLGFRHAVKLGCYTKEELMLCCPYWHKKIKPSELVILL